MSSYPTVASFLILGIITATFAVLTILDVLQNKQGR